MQRRSPIAGARPRADGAGGDGAGGRADGGRWARRTTSPPRHTGVNNNTYVKQQTTTHEMN